MATRFSGDSPVTSSPSSRMRPLRAGTMPAMVFIVTDLPAGAINVMTGFRGFRPSWLGKLSTLVQVIAVGMILLAAVTGYVFYLPTTYFIVVLLAFASGFHYVFHVARLMREADSTDA